MVVVVEKLNLNLHINLLVTVICTNLERNCRRMFFVQLLHWLWTTSFGVWWRDVGKTNRGVFLLHYIVLKERNHSKVQMLILKLFLRWEMSSIKFRNIKAFYNFCLILQLCSSLQLLHCRRLVNAAQPASRHDKERLESPFSKCSIWVIYFGIELHL